MRPTVRTHRIIAICSEDAWFLNKSSDFLNECEHKLERMSNQFIVHMCVFYFQLMIVFSFVEKNSIFVWLYTFGFVVVLEPKPNMLIQKMRKHPQMHDGEYARKRFGEATGFAPLVLPYVQDESRRIIYKIIEYDPLLDSSNMSIKDWVQIANDIKVRNLFVCLILLSRKLRFIYPNKEGNLVWMQLWLLRL